MAGISTGTAFDELHDQLGARGQNVIYSMTHWFVTLVQLQTTASNLAQLATMAEQFAHTSTKLKNEEREYERSRQYLIPLSGIVDDRSVSSKVQDEEVCSFNAQCDFISIDSQLVLTYMQTVHMKLNHGYLVVIL